ncbi:Arc family DNA-binding protein [Aeromicrobium sp. YC3-14]|nr:Arc family DNA-binding protein [Aeromicrobium stalagmiti]
MSMLTVRDLDPVVKAKLRERAARRGRSMEAEVRQILADAVATDGIRPSLADSVLQHFAGIDVELDLPDRSADVQHPVEL